MARTLDVWHVGRIDYDEAHALQQALVGARQRDEIDDTLLLLEHPPTITLGRGAKADHVLQSNKSLAAAGFTVHEVGRGGDVTYHGPGQLVAYPIVDLQPDRMDVRKYVASLEETMIRLAADNAIEAERIDGFNGTWVHARSDYPRKIGAVGVRISRWVTMHGFAFNVQPDLAHFGLIVPCGLTGKGVTSVRAELEDEAPSLRMVAERAAVHFAEIHNASVATHEGRPS